MRFSTAITLIASAGFAAAQTSTSAAASSQSTCQAEYIVQACLGSETAKVDACGANDWVCLCTNYQNVLTCYNNCPGDAAKATVESQVTAYCNAAAPLMSSKSAAAATATGSQSAAAATPTSSSASGTGSATGTATGASASHTGAASALAAPIGGALAIVFGVMGML